MSAKAHFICEFSAPEQGGHISAHFLPVHKVGKLPPSWNETNCNDVGRCSNLQGRDFFA